MKYIMFNEFGAEMPPFFILRKVLTYGARYDII